MPYVNSVIRSVDGKTLETSKRKRTVRAVWSDDSTDHYRTVFHQGGIDTSVFARNPAILFEHGRHPQRSTLPIGNAIDWSVERYQGRNALIGTTRFHEDEFSNDRFEDYASGRLRGWSVNCLPIDASPPTPAERRARPEWSQADTVFREVKLLEISAVTLPGNPGTLTLSVERSFNSVAPGRPLPTSFHAAWAERDRVEAELHRARRAGRRDEVLRLAGRHAKLEDLLRDWYRDPASRARHWAGVLAHEAANQRRALAISGGLKNLDGMSVEELKAEIERLKLMGELAELLGKHEAAAKHKAEAEAAAQMKAKFAKQANDHWNDHRRG